MQAAGEQANLPTFTGYEYLLGNYERAVSSEARTKIDALIREFASLKDTEKLLFCLLLPTEPVGGLISSVSGIPDDEFTPNGFDINNLGVGLFTGSGVTSSLHLSNQVEQSQAYTWIMSHLEEDESTCLRKDEVFEDYGIYCNKHSLKSLNTADFGKVMKRAFPNVKPRRLGQRGQSRYCYGGMRKKREVQPPSLPDLTRELSSTENVNSAGQRLKSSGDGVSYHHGTTSFPLSNSSLSGDETQFHSSIFCSDSVKSVLGVEGGLLGDVAQVLLDYGQQVFGITFSSLLQLAQHLVSNRYVTTRSRHALALIAQIFTSSYSASAAQTSSLSSHAAFSDAIQKGLLVSGSKHIFDRYSNGKTKSSLSHRVRSPGLSKNGDLHMKKEVRTPDNDFVTTGGGDQRQQQTRTTPTARPPSHGSSASSTASTGTAVPHPPPQTPPPLGICHQPSYRNTPVPSFQPNYPVSTPQTYHLSPASHYFNVSQFTSSAAVSPNISSLVASNKTNVMTTRPLVPSIASPDTLPVRATTSQHYLSGVADSQNPMNHQPYAHSGQSADRSIGFGSATASPSVPINNYHLAQIGGFANTIPSYRSNSDGTPTASPYASVYTSGYLSPFMSISTPHHQQPPAPLPPMAGARSPYAPVSYKRTPNQLPVEAPGAHEPLTRVHLGGSSPTKRSRFLSASLEGRLDYGDNATTYSRASSQPVGPTPGRQQHQQTHQQSGITVHLQQSDFYPNRYENMGLLSPATTPCPSSPHSKLTTPPSDPTLNLMRPWQAKPSPQLSTHLSQTYSSKNLPGFIEPLSHAMPQSLGGSSTPSFDVDMEDDDSGMDNMPRLGTSPGPQIPPSSPTEFLSFYSETAHNRTASVKSSLNPSVFSPASSLPSPHNHISVSNVRTLIVSEREQEGELDRTLTNLSPTPTLVVAQQDIDVVNSSNNSPIATSSVDKHKQQLHIFVADEDEEKRMILKREEMHGALLTPSAEGDNSTTASPLTPPNRDHFSSSHQHLNATSNATTSAIPGQQYKQVDKPSPHFSQITHTNLPNTNSSDDNDNSNSSSSRPPNDGKSISAF